MSPSRAESFARPLALAVPPSMTSIPRTRSVKRRTARYSFHSVKVIRRSRGGCASPRRISTVHCTLPTLKRQWDWLAALLDNSMRAFGFHERVSKVRFRKSHRVHLTACRWWRMQPHTRHVRTRQASVRPPQGGTTTSSFWTRPHPWPAQTPCSQHALLWKLSSASPLRRLVLPRQRAGHYHHCRPSTPCGALHLTHWRSPRPECRAPKRSRPSTPLSLMAPQTSRVAWAPSRKHSRRRRAKPATRWRQ
mmetsp:Transcript_837/g.2306  ORF Transcript_837/g.2306 Transcript_837/m.2306 type:complete len:249 (-) Transcript_837:3211-3957(-)